MVLLELSLEARQKREGVTGCSGEANQNFVVVKAANFFALAFMTVSPTVTWPSPAIATWPSRRTRRTVVLRTLCKFFLLINEKSTIETCPKISQASDLKVCDTRCASVCVIMLTKAKTVKD
jgi:hypothetical protein